MQLSVQQDPTLEHARLQQNALDRVCHIPVCTLVRYYITNTTVRHIILERETDTNVQRRAVCNDFKTCFHYAVVRVT